MKRILCTVLITLIIFSGTQALAQEPSLLPGDKSCEVAAVQTVLKRNGYYSGECGGVFDRETEHALAEFQRSHGISEGVAITLKTLSALGLYSGAESSGTGAVKEEEKLKLSGSSKALTLAVLPAGTAVEIINSKRGWSLVRLTQLGAEGYVRTSIINVHQSNKLHTSLTAPKRSLSRGEESADVAVLQKRLGELDYYQYSPSGSYGSVTYMAVRAFQRDNNIECTGVAGIETLSFMFSDDAQPRYAVLNEGEGIVMEQLQNEPLQEQAAIYSQLFLGIPYILGATGPKAYDCSGFTRMVYERFGYGLPRTAYSQGYGVGEKIKDIKNLECGDLVFFNTNPNDGDRCDHTGIYIGEGRFVHASTSDGKIIISDINKYYWSDIFSWGRRILS